MSVISKTELFYKDYSWTVLSGDNPKISGEPDSTLLNRKEGYEILYFVNKFCEKHELKQKNSGLKVEKMIRNEVPNEIHSQEKISGWLVSNWKESKF